MNDLDPRQNPLVERAFRSGFRSGPGSFRLGWYLAGLALATIGPFVPKLFEPAWGVGDAAQFMLPGLLLLLLAIFVIGGFQRMLGSFTQERERGTFDFLHLSTLRSSAIVLGFLWAGQLPGYLAAVLLAPLLFCAAFFADFPLLVLAEILASLVLLVLSLSVLFLFYGFWAKKVSEFRGAAFVYAMVAVFGGWGIANTLVKLRVLPDGVPQAALGVPVLVDLYSLGVRAADSGGSGTPALLPLHFYGIGLPPWLFGAVLVLPAVVLVFAALARALRHRDRVPWSVSHATLLFAWGAIALVGVWWGTGIPPWMRSLALSAYAWFAIRRLLERCTLNRSRTVQALGRSGGTIRGLLAADEGPPLRLAASLFAVWFGASLLLSAGVRFEPVVSDPAAAVTNPLLWAIAPALFLLPLAAITLYSQWMAWQRPGWRWTTVMLTLLLVVAPACSFAFSEALATLHLIPVGLLVSYGGLSPFSQLLALAHPRSSGYSAGSWPVVAQVAYVIAVVWGVVALRRSAEALAARSRKLRAGLDGDRGAPPPVPAGAAPGREPA